MGDVALIGRLHPLLGHFPIGLRLRILRSDPRFQALGAALVSVDKRNIRCARPVYIAEGS
jgi:hypothetical protein